MRRLGWTSASSACSSSSGLDPTRDGIVIAPITGGLELKVNTGVSAAKALESGAIDGFWANGMGAELAVRRGVGTVVIDVRRGDGPPGAFDYTFPVVAAADELIAMRPDTAAGVVRAVVAAQSALRGDVSLAAQVAHKFFPPDETALIEDIVARDLPYYDASISGIPPPRSTSLPATWGCWTSSLPMRIWSPCVSRTCGPAKARPEFSCLSGLLE